MRSMLPKNAINFHKLKKGLYLNYVKRPPSEDVATQQSLKYRDTSKGFGDIMQLKGASSLKRRVIENEMSCSSISEDLHQLATSSAKERSSNRPSKKYMSRFE
jgi:hypothetical protein